MRSASTSTPHRRAGVRFVARRGLRHALAGAFVGLAVYLALLIAHLVQYRTISHAVPSICTWAGRYPGYCYTWDLTALNLSARLIDDAQALRGRGVMPQRVRFHGERPRVPPAWNASAWVAAGALGYAIACALVAGLCSLVDTAMGSQRRTRMHGSPRPPGRRRTLRPPRADIDVDRGRRDHEPAP
jgi:hypothetical protein